jgi:L-seryl-tRNA(Ser) seleniumtransferase
VTCAPCQSQIGSGALPVERLASTALTVRPAARRPGKALLALESALRQLPVPVIGYLRDDALWLDLRCLEHKDEAAFAAQLAALPSLLNRPASP